MAIYRHLLSALLLAIALLILAPGASLAAGAGNQAIDQPTTLIGPEPETQIAIYPKPATRPGPLGYGISGDSVTVLEQVGSNQGITWDAVRFNNPPYAQGWVQAEFVSLPTAAETGSNQKAQPNRYLGNQQPQSKSQSGSQQQYSQQNQY
ncbi:MAG: hypothetical protein ACFB0C_05740 [Leptolyngbyaceae cyanobacterium]